MLAESKQGPAEHLRAGTLIRAWRGLEREVWRHRKLSQGLGGQVRELDAAELLSTARGSGAQRAPGGLPWR